jgi:hypothetical protein
VSDLVDISPGWQDRAARLAETIRTCQHTDERLVNVNGCPYCSKCGRLFPSERRHGGDGKEK